MLFLSVRLLLQTEPVRLHHILRYPKERPRELHSQGQSRLEGWRSLQKPVISWRNLMLAISFYICYLSNIQYRSHLLLFPCLPLHWFPVCIHSSCCLVFLPMIHMSWSCCFLFPRVTRRDPRVPWSVCHRLQRPFSCRAVSLGAGWLPRSSWSGWSATRRPWCANVRGTSARESACPPPPAPPTAPPHPPGCPPAPPILQPLYVTPSCRAAAADTGSTTFTTAAMPPCSPQPHNNLAGMLTH